MNPLPVQYLTNRLREKIPSLFEGKTHRDARNWAFLNLLNVNDHLLNWDRLDDSMQSDLTCIIEGDWDEGEWEDGARRGYNRSAGGIKGKSDAALAEQLLLYAGLGIRDMVFNGYKIIPSNVRDRNGHRDRHTTSLGFIDPRAANAKIADFFKRYDPARLMPRFSATRVLFNSPEDLWEVGDRTDLVRDSYNDFFEGVAGRLSKWYDQGSIVACFARFEIGIKSLAASIFHPHVHAVIWHRQDHTRKFLQQSYLRGEIEEIQEPQRYWREIRNFVRYMMQVQPIGPRCRIEWDENHPEEVNQLFRRGLRNYIEVHMHPGAEVHKDREFKRNLPKARA